MQNVEIVLTMKLTVASDLELSWSLVSEAEAQGQTRHLSWSDRVSAGSGNVVGVVGVN
jgi:putative ATP-dependent endonuclease of the OLD family